MAGCDCTVFCGDDPKLKEGGVEPCEPLARRLAINAARAVDLAAVQAAFEADRPRDVLPLDAVARLLGFSTYD